MRKQETKLKRRQGLVFKNKKEAALHSLLYYFIDSIN